MKYKEVTPYAVLRPYIHCFWELRGEGMDEQWERIFPDGCAGLILNIGETCITDNGSVSMAFGKTYAVGAMTSFKDSYINQHTHLFGVCLKPAAFANFYKYADLNELTNSTIELEQSISLEKDELINSPFSYLNQYYIDRIRNKDVPLHSVITDIHNSNGSLSIYELSKRNYITTRKLERYFKSHIGMSPKEYSNIVRFQKALSEIRNSTNKRSLSDIAVDCGFYDHSHLTNEIKRNTGISPSQL